MKILLTIFVVIGLLTAPIALANSTVTYDWIFGQSGVTDVGTPADTSYYDWIFGQSAVVEQFVAAVTPTSTPTIIIMGNTIFAGNSIFK